MNVLDVDGSKAGSVSEVRTDDFLINRSLAPDVYLPYSAVHNVAGSTITLNLSAAQIDDLSWDEGPPAAGKS
jgi:hypothetical protein